MKIDGRKTPSQLRRAANQVFELATQKVRGLDRSWNVARGAPVFTVNGRYTTRGWTEWTHGFQYGCALLVFDATGDRFFLELGRRRTIDHMPVHLTHAGVHDHGFNTLSTYGNLRRLMSEGRIDYEPWEQHGYELALRCSGAVQAMRWSDTAEPDSAAGGYIYSFNGPHSLFIDTMRTIRVLGVAHRMGHYLMGEHDQRINLLGRLVVHGLTSAKHLVFDGRSGHHYDVRGRTAHEGIFNRNDGRFRSRATQQGYSPFSTWTRGLAWAMLGFAEQLEFLKTVPADQFPDACGLRKSAVMSGFRRAAIDSCDHYIHDCSTADGLAYWDDGAPGLAHLGHWQGQAADPHNDYEPVDSSAAAIAAQGLLRLGRHLGTSRGKKYRQAGLTIAQTLMSEQYLAVQPRHQGLLLHSIYHRPEGWDHRRGQKVPSGESSLWGDYHLLELANLIVRLADGQEYPTFF